MAENRRPPRQREPSLLELCDEYVRDLTARTTAEHATQVERRLRFLIAQFGNRRASRLKPVDVIRVRNEMRATGKSNGTCNGYTHHALKAMLRWAYDSGLTASNPIHGLKRLRQSAECATFRRRPMTEAEISRFIAAAENEDADAVRTAASRGRRPRIPLAPMWIAFLETGARWNELRQLTWRDVDFDRSVLTLRAENTKSRRSRSIPIRPDLLDRLRALAQLHESILVRPCELTGQVFLTPAGRPWIKSSFAAMKFFDRVLARARIPRRDADGGRLDIHALRHTFASRLCRAGVGLVHAQKLLGHSDPRLTTAIYVHLNVEDLRKAIVNLPDTTDWVG